MLWAARKSLWITGHKLFIGEFRLPRAGTRVIVPYATRRSRLLGTSNGPNNSGRARDHPKNAGRSAATRDAV